MSSLYDASPEDPFKKLQKISEKFDTLKHVHDAMKYVSPLAAHLKLIDPLAGHRKFLDPLISLKSDQARFSAYDIALQEIKRLDVHRHRDNFGIGVLIQAQQSPPIFDPLGEHHKLQGVLAILNSQQNSLKMLDPLEDLRRSLKTVEPLKKYSSMMDAGGSLRLLDRVLNQPLDSWTVEAQEQSGPLRRMFEAISSVQFDLRLLETENAEYEEHDDVVDVSCQDPLGYIRVLRTNQASLAAIS